MPLTPIWPTPDQIAAGYDWKPPEQGGGGMWSTCPARLMAGPWQVDMRTALDHLQTTHACPIPAVGGDGCPFQAFLTLAAGARHILYGEVNFASHAQDGTLGMRWDPARWLIGPVFDQDSDTGRSVWFAMAPPSDAPTSSVAGMPPNWQAGIWTSSPSMTP
ncbi:MAG: hypothetical protein OXC91_06440 [Rhodobacteraceae bacterium]|nr:hypothetical protein [Paracoccaceae bacterium]